MEKQQLRSNGISSWITERKVKSKYQLQDNELPERNFLTGVLIQQLLGATTALQREVNLKLIYE